MTTFLDIQDFAQTRWPLAMAADWDNPGVAIGAAEAEISRVLLTVDVTPEVLDEAIEGRFQLIFSHHPLIFSGLKTLDESTTKGALVSRCVKNSIAVYSAHTNADFCSGGVSESLAITLGVQIKGPLTPSGEGVIGEIQPTSLVDFARLVARKLSACAQGVLVQGDPNRLVSRVGLVAGAGDSYLNSVQDLDLFITSDLRHHPASDFRDSSAAALMNIPHFAAEEPWLHQAAAELAAKFPSVEFVVSGINTDPWNFAVMQ